MSFYFTTMLITVSILLIINKILKSKPKSLVIIYFSIWNKPFPTKREIDNITVLLVFIAYVIILTISIVKHY